MADEHKAGRKIGGLLAASIAAGVVLIAFGAMTLIAPFFQLSYAPTGSGRLAQARSTPAPAESDWPEPPQWGPEIPADLSAYSGTASRPGQRQVPGMVSNLTAHGPHWGGCVTVA